MDVRNTILIVDDMASNRIFLGNIFRDQYKLLEAGNGDVAMRLLRKRHGQIIAVLLDIIMPVKDGFRTLEDMRREGFLQDIPVLVVTSDLSTRSETRALELGAADLIKKPYDPFVIKRRVSNMIELFENRKKLESRVDDLSRAMNATNTSIINTLAAVTEFRSLESGRHIHRIQEFTRIALETVSETCPQYRMTREEMELIASASVMHDIGKIAIPDAVLNKPGRLTPEEFEIMKTHCISGCRILNSIEDALDKQYARYAYHICRYHHERWDGRGYPDGLKQDNIPLCAQVVALADVYDALTTHRVYKDAFPHEEAMRMILAGECGAFNPELLKCLRLAEKRFEKCARDYADASALPMEDISMPMPPSASMSLMSSGDLELAMGRYHAMLQLVDGMVLEVDMDKGTYKRVHNTAGAFENARSGRNIHEALQDLLNSAIHPDDKKLAAGHMLSFRKEFFEDGLRKQTTCYRMRNSPWSDYYWVQATNLRVSTNNPGENKALCVWDRMFDGSSRSDGHNAVDMQFWSRFPFILMRCRLDWGMTIEKGTERLAALLGYTRTELEEVSGNCLMELLAPEDQELVRLRMRESRMHEDSVSMEYRLLHKDGSVVWVQDHSRVLMEGDGNEHVYRMLLDRTRDREELDRLRFTLERHQMLMSNTDEIYFECDLRNNQGTVAETFYRTFGYGDGMGDLAFTFSDAVQIVHPEDMEKFYNMMQEIERGMNVVTGELRLRKVDGEYIWCNLRIIAQQRDGGHTFMLAGTIRSIHEERMAIESLREQMTYDGLTNVLNREAVGIQIDQYFQQWNEHDRGAALLVMDIDGFQKVNDTCGHLTGDTILIACAEMITRLFRITDIVGRVGGDEFLLLLRDTSDRAAVEKCCQKIRHCFWQEVAGRLPDRKLTCSIGVAVAPGDGASFLELFEKADIALRCAKDRGRDQVVFYDEVGEDAVNYLPMRTAIDSEKYSVMGELSMVEYAMHEMYRSGDIEGTIRTLMDSVGRRLGVSRVYIFENSRDNRYTSNTFEWCADGIEPAIDTLQRISYETDIPGWAELFDEDGILYCRSVAELRHPKHRAMLERQGIRSMLHCAIRDDGIFRGFVGFDECHKERVWTRDELKMLNALSESISLFLLKKRTQDDMAAWSDSLLHVLNHASDLIYVVDSDTHELLFMNERLQRLAALRLGDQCYRAFLNRETPCEDCPITRGSASVIINDHLNCRVRAESSGMVWDGRDAELIICEQLADE